MSGPGPRSRRNERLGSLLRHAREKAGLTQRQLAERMDISWVAISQAENGADIRHSTLRGFLKALPGLTPAELLQGPAMAAASSEPTRRETWSYYRDLLGLEAEAIGRALTVGSDGVRTDRFHCRGLRSIRDNPVDLRLLEGLESLVFQGSRVVLTEVRAARTRGTGGEDDLRSRVLEKRADRFLHQFTVPADLARDGLDYSWSHERSGLPLWREESLHFRPGETERVHSGIGLRVTLPARSLRLRLRFPEGYWPAKIYLRLWPTAAVPDPRVRDFAKQVHPEGLHLRRDRRRGLVTLTAQHPLLDWSYNIGWILPPRPTQTPARERDGV